MEALLLAIPLPKPKRNRADVLQAERLSARRHSLRSKRHNFLAAACIAAAISHWL
jgi:hypothetical protein